MVHEDVSQTRTPLCGACVRTSPGAGVSMSCWIPARVLITVHHEGIYFKDTWARMAKCSLAGVRVHCICCVLTEMRTMRL
jgi:hypothetical protein